jgi:Zn-dependent membrane protease YugP
MSNYELRGNRVVPLEAEAIVQSALMLGKVLKLSKRNRKKIDKSFEQLSAYGITVNPIDDSEWLGLTKGHFDPPTRTISIPEKIYDAACDGEQDALSVMLHELGHLFLGHKAVLHKSDTPATIHEDAEWQADTFAEAILISMGYKTNQLMFDFYM